MNPSDSFNRLWNSTPISYFLPVTGAGSIFIPAVKMFCPPSLQPVPSATSVVATVFYSEYRVRMFVKACIVFSDSLVIPEKEVDRIAHIQRCFYS